MDAPQQHRRLIINGHTLIDPQRYPYYVAIDKNNGDPFTPSVIVSGALIAPDIVLSAGHVALSDLNNVTIKIGPFAVHANEEFSETLPVKSWFLYKNWTFLAPDRFGNDYMIFQLTNKSTHSPIRINRDVTYPTPGDLVTIMGCGLMNETYMSPSSYVQQTKLLVISNEECDMASDPARPDKAYKGTIVESMFCTKSPPNKITDGCAWDSGDPVIIKGNTADEDVLVGLVSAGEHCADPFFPSIQARIATKEMHGLQWIREQVCKLSSDPPDDFECFYESFEHYIEQPSVSSSSSSSSSKSNRHDKSAVVSNSKSIYDMANNNFAAVSDTDILSTASVSIGYICLVVFVVAGMFEVWRKVLKKKHRIVEVERVYLVPTTEDSRQHLGGYESIESS